MLIVILVDAQYLQNVVFSFEKGLNGQNHSLWDSHHPLKKSSKQNWEIPPYPLMLFEKPWISNMPRVGFKPTQKPSSGFDKWSYAVMTTTISL